MLLLLAVSHQKTVFHIVRALRALPDLVGPAQAPLGTPSTPAHRHRSPLSAHTGSLSPLSIGVLVYSTVPRTDLMLVPCLHSHSCPHLLLLDGFWDQLLTYFSRTVNRPHYSTLVCPPWSDTEGWCPFVRALPGLGSPLAHSSQSIREQLALAAPWHFSMYYSTLSDILCQWL